MGGGTAMRRVLGRANSSNVMKVLCLLDHLGLDYQREDYGGAFGRTQDAAYLAMNPNGVVPTLVEGGVEDGVEDGFVLWESNVILRYLAAAHGAGTPLWPEGLRARAGIEQWMDWQQTTLAGPMTTVFWGLVRTAPEARDWAAIRAAAGRLGRLYGMLEEVLGRHAFVAGADLTPADLAIGVHAHRYMLFEGIEKPGLPNVRAWYGRLLAVPAYARHVAGVPMT